MDTYTKHFAGLRTDTSPARWSAATNHHAPHKPFLLLAVMDLIAQGLIKTNFVELNADLMDTFDLYWVKVIGQEKDGNTILPFYHLKSNGFWHLVPMPGMEQALAASQQIRSIGQLRQLVLGAKFDDTLFEMLLDERQRDNLRRVLIESYFAPAIRPQVVEIGRITAESFDYSHELVDRLRGRFTLKEAPEPEGHYHVEARSTAFRRVVVEAYNHTCAVCGIRVVTPEGRTAVAASHIVPWNVSHNDDPRNGMALCGLHHWILDQGMIGVTPEYQIRVSPVISADEESAKPLLLLAESLLHQPTDSMLRPAKAALHWHWENVFRARTLPRLL